MLFGCSAPLISTLTGSGSALSIAGLLYAGATLALLGGVVGPVAPVLGLARLPAATSSLLLNLEAVFTLALLGIGALGYGISIWLDLLALRDLGAAREAVLFSTAPFVGALFSVVVLRESLSAPLLLATGLMGAGVVLLLHEQHSQGIATIPAVAIPTTTIDGKQPQIGMLRAPAEDPQSETSRGACDLRLLQNLK